MTMRLTESELNSAKIEADVFGGPIGGYGFRSGNWTITVNGQKCRMYCSISHRLPLNEQKGTLIAAAKRTLMSSGLEVMEATR